MFSNLEKITCPFNIARRLEEIGGEYDKLQAAMEAFAEFSGLYSDNKHIEDIKTRPEHFEMLWMIIFDYAHSIQCALTELETAAYEYSRTTAAD